MNSHSHGCDSCAKVCDEAKTSVKTLQKKVYALTIVCTSALTLLGEQGAKAVMSTVNSMNSAMAAVDGKTAKDTKEPTKTSLNDRIIGRPWSPKSPHGKEEQANFKNSDLLTMVKKKPQQEKQPEIVIPQVPQSVVQSVYYGNNQNLTPMDPINANTLNPADPFAVFLTPSTLPFDVYSTTLALGNNYGFGEYYGYGSLNASGTSIPEAGTVSVLTLGTLINTRKRN